MGTTLDHGIYLPDEGERNCYDGLAGNWVALDNHLGSTDIHVTINDKQAWNGHIADTTIHVTSADKQAWNGHIADSVKHVTAEDKQAWNGKADNSALTAHTGDTTIHVTSADKQAWDGHVADSVKHVTAEDKNKWDAVTSKADDSDVVHKSGDETIRGIKTFKGMIPIDGDYLGNEASDNQRTNICLRSNRDTADKSGAFITRFRQNRSQGALQTGDLQMIGFDVLENEVRTNNVFSIQCSGWVDNVPTKVKLLSTGSDSTFGTSARPSKINDLNPSSLSLPSGNASDSIDISSYLSVLDGSNANTYVAPANGWISIAMSNCMAIQAFIKNGLWGHQVIRPTAGGIRFLMPILKNLTANISIVGGTIFYARFIPCQGNV